MFYVTMTDKFMSGWGLAEGRINRLVFPCSDYDQAEIVATNAEKRGDMSRINICYNKPRYSSETHFVQEKTIENCPKWYEKGAFVG